MGANRAEIRKGLGTPEGTPAPHQMVANLYVESVEDFQAATQTAQFKEVMSYIPNVYKDQPAVMVTSVALEVAFER